MNQRDVILSRIEAAPPLPTTATRVFELLGNSDADISELVDVVQYDPGLTSNVLRLANAASFASSTEIVSLRNAMVRLGTRQVSQLIILSVGGAQMRPAVKGYDLPPGKLLEHSIAVAFCGEELAKELGIEAADQVFTAGLLHDIGKVLLGAFVEVDAAPILDLAHREEISFEAAERDILGIDHAEVGARLLDNWKLPASIVDSARWHHQPECLENGDLMTIDLVHVADNLSLMAGIGVGIDGLNYYPSPETMARLRLKRLTLEGVMSRMMTRLEGIRDVLATNAGRG